VIGIAVVIAIAAIAVMALRRGGTFAGSTETAPDIILVTIDTLRADGISFSGSTRVKTPFLDELARNGVFYKNAHAHNVVTLPSHSNILTGLLPYQHGVRENAGFVLDPKHKTVAHHLKEAGYATGAFVSAFPLDGRFGLGAGFDVYDDKYHEGTAPTQFVVPERPAAETFADARQWYDSVEGRKRFMWVHVYEPHAPYEPPSPFKEQYPKNPYYGEVAHTDDALGSFLRPILEKNPNTLVIVTSDHGEGMNEHGEITHGVFAYEETLHVPLIVHEKDRVKPRIENEYVRHVDIVPTILERAGIEKPADLPGESLLEIERPRDTYFEALTANINLGWAPLIGMIHEGHKYIDLPLAELYDLEKDRAEKRNILQDDRRMTTKMRSMLANNAPDISKIERNLSTEEARKLLSLGYLAGTAAAKKEYTADDDPKNVVHLHTIMMTAIAAYQRGNMTEAMQLARGLIEQRPEMAMARDLLAFLLQESDRGGDAEAVIREAMAKGTASDSMRKRLGMILSESGRAAEAVEILEPFASSKDPDLLNAYGIALADLGRFQPAVQQFERALRIDRTNATAYQNLGVVALRAGDVMRAEQYLDRALQLNQKLPLALNSMGVVFARRNDLAGALEWWKKAVAVDPKQYDAWFNIGLVSGSAGRRDEARRALTQFVETAPKERYAEDIARARSALTALR
jgi:arylsulfatase A-like enzyme/Tfp pilus assembly protein PilF